MRRPAGALGVVALVGMLVGTLASWATPWTPPLPWFGDGGRATQTAVVRAATSAARTATAAAWPTLRPTRTHTPTRTRTVTPTATPTGTVTPTSAAPPQPAGETPVAVSSYAPRPLFTPPPLEPLTGAAWPLDTDERAYLDALNRQRVALGLPPVVPDPALMAAAQWHAMDMATVGYLSHRDSLGRDSGRRMNDFGSSPYVNRCNIAQGRADTAFGGVDAWVVWDQSNSHRLCQTDPRYALIGIGRAWGPIDGWRWSVDFSEPI